jgi:hypothetical protein
VHPRPAAGVLAVTRRAPPRLTPAPRHAAPAARTSEEPMPRSRSHALAAAAASALALAVPAHAARAQLGIAAGVTVPQGDYGDAAKGGFVLNPFLEVGAGPVAVRASVLWTRSDIDDGFLDDIPSPPANANVSGNVNLIGGSLDAKLSLPVPLVTPYIIGGVGVYRQSVEQELSGVVGEIGDIDESNTEMGYNVGVGVQLPTPVVRLFAEARWYSVRTTPKQNFVPITVGVRF